MCVIPVKWLPYLFIISGVYGLVSGDMDISTGTAIILIVLGSVWLYLKHSSRPAVSSAKSAEAVTALIESNSVEELVDSSEIANRNRYCSCCGAVSVAPESIFCSSCGNML